MDHYREDYRITSFLVNLRHRAGLFAMLNLIQDVGWQHAVKSGVRFDDQSMLWVFTRQKLAMKRWPAWNEVVTLETWLRPAGNSPFILRDYEISVAGEKVGECTSSFTVIDPATRKVAQPDWSRFDRIWRWQGHLALAPQKVQASTDCQDLADFEVRNSDLDLNNHVNNTKYANWILDAVPLERLRKADLHEYEVNFLAETRKGDVVTVQQFLGQDETDIRFQGMRKSDGKVVFTARMKVSE